MRHRVLSHQNGEFIGSKVVNACDRMIRGQRLNQGGMCALLHAVRHIFITSTPRLNHLSTSFRCATQTFVTRVHLAPQSTMLPPGPGIDPASARQYDDKV
jgi:hypothetical protein